MSQSSNLRVYINRTLFTSALLLAICLIAAPAAFAQQDGQSASVKADNVQAKAVAGGEKAREDVVKPKWEEYKGVRIGMSAEEVRGKLAGLKDKGKVQDFFILSDAENVQVYYDEQGKVQAVSVNYVDAKMAPDAAAVLGEEVQASEDGSVYKLVRYPDAGYWVAYSRTAGKAPLVTVTIQKM